MNPWFWRALIEACAKTMYYVVAPLVVAMMVAALAYVWAQSG